MSQSSRALELERDEAVPGLWERLREAVRRPPLLLLAALGLLVAIGLTVQYSAGGGSVEPWLWSHAVRIGIGFAVMAAVALMDVRVWLGLAYPIYVAAIVFLLLVEFAIGTGPGADRWLALGPFRFQPAELAKIAMVLALARYFHLELADRKTWTEIPVVLLFIVPPVFLVFRQPDLGTALTLAMVGLACVFLAGIDRRLIVGSVALGVAAAPLAWFFALHAYQRDRLLTYFNPEADPLGAGYHAMQSKIAVGSGGIDGKGFLHGTQSHLDFLPELHTDFAFTVFAEEFGLLGSLLLLGLYVGIIGCGMAISIYSRNHFGRVVAGSMTFIIFLYVFINVAMTVALVPVVGIPLPPVSYGGTAVITLFACIGFLINVHVHRNRTLSRAYQLPFG